MKRVAEAEGKLVLKIPRIVRFRPIVVELERTIVVAFNVEHVRIVIRV